MTADASLRLEVTDFQDAQHWRWLLRDASGAFVADHSVALDAATPEYAGFLDLDAYLDRYAAPDKWPEDHARLVGEIGAWVGAHVLGPVGDAILRHGTPATVRVILPPEAEGLLYCPLEVAHIDAKPLALQDISLVLEVTEATPAVVHQPIGDRLRVLAIFSLPSGASALALRRERYELQRLLHSISEEHGLAIELQVLQYGVTRERLEAVLEDGEGWDVIHFSGHGEEGVLVLEQADGGLDEVTTGGLCALLRRARGRVKLVTLAACLSAAATVAETRQWLGLPPHEGGIDKPATGGGQPAISAVARMVMRELDCAVLAMRFPVGDDFAIGLTARLYGGLIERKQRLPRALQLALPAALGDRPHPGVPPLSVATPALFGRPAADLELRPPRAAVASFALAPASMAHFPDEPPRFVGRSGAMARACAAVSRNSGRSGVLFHGMVGGGKTACALELAYHYQRDRFRAFVWYQAPEEGKGIDMTLRDFALAMEAQLPDFAMVHVVDQEAALQAWLPRLTQVLRDRSLLIMLDNLESLLDERSYWRDPRWGEVVRALLNHDGPSRTVLTSRRVPVGLDEDRVLVEPVHALSLDESLILARESPNLGRLLRGEGIGLDPGRALVLRTLRLVQGHPKLIELAEAQAADAGRLAESLDHAAAVWAGGEGSLSAFLARGKTAIDAERFLAALAGWTNAISASLPGASRLLFHVLCALEEEDRDAWVLRNNWSDLWRHLDRAGAPPDLDLSLSPVLASGLADVRGKREIGGRPILLYRVHPGVAEAGRERAGRALQRAVDEEVGAFWVAALQKSRQGDIAEGSRAIAVSALHAVPYAMRLKQWDAAASLLEQAMGRGVSPGIAAAALPSLRHIASLAAASEVRMRREGILAKALAQCGRGDEAEAIIRGVLQRAEDEGESVVAFMVAGQLVTILSHTGRCREALVVVEHMKRYPGFSGLGPLTRLSVEGLRVQVLVAMGRHDDVLSSVGSLEERIDGLLEGNSNRELVVAWSLRESLLASAATAAVRVGQWELALSFSRRQADSQRARRAPALEVARTRINEYGPLLAQGRHEETMRLLQECRETFEREGDTRGLGLVFSALAVAEGASGHASLAVRHEETSLRYAYTVGDPQDCMISHHNLARYMIQGRGQGRVASAHELAAALIGAQTESLQATVSRGLVESLLRASHAESDIPGSFDDLCAVVEQVEGVRFRELLRRLPRRFATGDEALQAVLSLARQPLQAREAQDARPADEPPPAPT